MYHKIKKSFYNCYFNTNCMMMVLGNYESNLSKLLVCPECNYHKEQQQLLQK